jgi:hypothetical protein
MIKTLVALAAMALLALGCGQEAKKSVAFHGWAILDGLSYCDLQGTADCPNGFPGRCTVLSNSAAGPIEACKVGDVVDIAPKNSR